MSLRSEVLKAFKVLHRTKDKVFQGDVEMISVFRQEINEYFRNNKAEKDPEKIKQLIKEAYLAEDDLRTKIIQVEKTAPGYYKAKVREDHCVTDIGMANPKKKVKEK